MGEKGLRLRSGSDPFHCIRKKLKPRHEELQLTSYNPTPASCEKQDCGAHLGLVQKCSPQLEENNRITSNPHLKRPKKHLERKVQGHSLFFFFLGRQEIHFFVAIKEEQGSPPISHHYLLAMYHNPVFTPHPSFPSLVDPSLIPKSAQKISQSVQFSLQALDSPKLLLILDELGWSNKMLNTPPRGSHQSLRRSEILSTTLPEGSHQRDFGGEVETHHLEDHIKATSTLRSTNTSVVVICLSQKTNSPRGSHQIDHVETLPPRGSHQIYHVEMLPPRGSHQIST